MKVFKNLFGNNSKINASEIALKEKGVPQTLQDYVDNKSSFILYDNPSGSNTNITMNDTAANYSYIEIYFYVNGDLSAQYNFVRVDNPNGKTVNLICNWVSFKYSVYVMNTNAMQFNGNVGTMLGGAYVHITSNVSTGFARTNSTYITKIVGYK